MTKRSLKRHALTIVLSTILTGTLAAQGGGVVWNLSVQLTERDKRDIIGLAAELGIRTPGRVVDNRSPCPLVSLSSQPVVEGNRVTTTVLGMRPLSGPDCPLASSGPNVHRRGNWIAITFDPQDMYEVMSATHEDFTGRGGGGHMLHVKIRNGRVELHGSFIWMS